MNTWEFMWIVKQRSKKKIEMTGENYSRSVRIYADKLVEVTELLE